ncbi:MAG TPA: right-handed parallel beta-helix repeat-containing protein [Planctomycetota bacterium]|nr:right-handed parallel beta-helix repeat-containing protein [Planctomycetota bacterium]
MHARLPAICLALAFAGNLALAQQEIWIDPVLGNNGNPGTYPLPMLTLAQALAVAGPNAKIMLLPGLYGPSHNGEILPLSLGLVPQQNLVIRGIGAVVFDLNGATVPMFRLVAGASGCRITNLTITNMDRTQWWTRVVNSGSGVNTMDAAQNVEFDRCRIDSVNRGFVLWTNDNVQGWRIHDNLFVNCTNDAILEYSGNNEVYNNTFVNNPYKAYISDSATSRCYNNLIVGHGIAFENNNAANNTARYQNNWIWQTGIVTQGQGFAGGLPPSNVAGQDPMLVNPAGGDYHLQTGSPLIDRGNPAIFARADNDGVARIVDYHQNGSLLPDIGAYERSPLALTVTWDPTIRLLYVTPSGIPGALAFVLFSFDDGLVQLPGQGPILVDPNTYIPVTLNAPLPHSWTLNLNAVPPFAPGTRLVMQALAIVPGATSLIGSNQVWTQI